MVELENFFTPPEKDISRENILQPNEVITDIFVPGLATGARSLYLKQKEKQSFDWPLADVAVVVEMANGRCAKARIVLGAAAPVPWRARAAEQAIIGKPINAETARVAGHAALESAQPLAHNGYKLALFETLVARALMGAAQQR